VCPFILYSALRRPDPLTRSPTFCVQDQENEKENGQGPTMGCRIIDDDDDDDDDNNNNNTNNNNERVIGNANGFILIIMTRTI
jgi:hypothetical protein